MLAIRRKQKGFTIIEVLIVLTIASIILIIVLIAVPALQRNARNTQRRHDVAAVLASISQEITNNGGRLPESCNNTWVGECFLRDLDLGYYDNKSTEDNNVSLWNKNDSGPFDPSVDLQLDPDDPISRERISVRTWSKCGDNGEIVGVGTDVKRRDVAAQFVIETFGGGSLACIEI